MQIIVEKEKLNLLLKRLAYQISEFANSESIAIIGVQPRGVPVSDKIYEYLCQIDNNKHDYGKIDISFYRDDYKQKLNFEEITDINFSIENKKIILIDDVLYTGRTIRAAMDALMDYGRPSEVALCVLVDRKYNRELPIAPTLSGIVLDTFTSQKIKVNMQEQQVFLY